ncbi:hypothetical protein GGR52DRAFT_559872 [Hypoxylon sp. FL1284]|nr:hypothetical protein GGR52DRAFT_559872 [Hypoxylon sp. FL1284]
MKPRTAMAAMLALLLTPAVTAIPALEAKRDLVSSVSEGNRLPLKPQRKDPFALFLIPLFYADFNAAHVDAAPAADAVVALALVAAGMVWWA